MSWKDVVVVGAGFCHSGCLGGKVDRIVWGEGDVAWYPVESDAYS